jgi:hypothetical protein
MNKLYEAQLKDTSGVTHVFMRGPHQDVINRVMNYPSDDIPMHVEEQDRGKEYFLHFVLI